MVLDIFAESINSDGSKGEKISSAESTGMPIFHTSDFHVIFDGENNGLYSSKS